MRHMEVMENRRVAAEGQVKLSHRREGLDSSEKSRPVGHCGKDPRARQVAGLCVTVLDQQIRTSLAYLDTNFLFLPAVDTSSECSIFYILSIMTSQSSYCGCIVSICVCLALAFKVFKSRGCACQAYLVTKPVPNYATPTCFVRSTR